MDAHRNPSVPAVVYARRMCGQEGAALVHEPIPGPGGAHDFSPGSPSPSNKRFSLSSRRPLRSSPLAGPALSRSPTMQTEVGTEESLVIYSTPASPSPVTLSPKRSRTPNDLVRFSESLLNQPQVRTTSSNTSSASRLPAHSSFHQTYDSQPFLSYPPIEPLRPVPVLVSAPFSVDEVSPLASRIHHRTLSEQPTACTSILRPPVTPSRRNSQPTGKTAPRTSTRVLRTPPSPPKSQAGLDNWMTANTYAMTPRFSRLGLTAPNVILPIPAREYKRVAAKKAKPSPGRDLPLTGMRSFESLATTESTISSSLETLPLSLSSSMVPCGTSLSDTDTVVEGKKNTKIVKAEHSGVSHLHLKRCSSPSSIYSSESMESHVFKGSALETVIEGCSEDGFIIGRRVSSLSRPGSDMIRQTHGGVLSKFWKRLVGIRR